jgi:hypothetical protein
MLFSKREAWIEEEYVEKYGEERFFKDLDMYEEIIGKTWDEIIAEEQPANLVAIHEKALAAIRLKQVI